MMAGGSDEAMRAAEGVAMPCQTRGCPVVVPGVSFRSLDTLPCFHIPTESMQVFLLTWAVHSGKQHVCHLLALGDLNPSVLGDHLDTLA